MYTYLLLNIGTILFPFALSFDKRVAFFRNWKALFPAIFLVGAVFIIWDIAFTELGVWSFNPEYLTGITWVNLPIEEWLFFFTVPYACVFIYECIRSYFPSRWEGRVPYTLAGILGIALLVTGMIYHDRLYTMVTFSACGALLIGSYFNLFPAPIGRFFQMYLIHLIPFFLINGILTALPVVMYNDGENLAIRMGTIPFEDAFYSMLLLLLNIHLYEFFKHKYHVNAQFTGFY